MSVSDATCLPEQAVKHVVRVELIARPYVLDSATKVLRVEGRDLTGAPVTAFLHVAEVELERLAIALATR